MKQKLFSSIVIFTVIGLTLFFISGCSKEEIQKLRSENEAIKSESEKVKTENETLKTQIASLEQAISKLKETPESHYQRGIDLLKDSKYEEAKAEFEAVTGRYPTNPLVSSAKQQIETVNREIKKAEAEKLAEERSRKRKEEEQYRPKSVEEAIAEWKEFRREPTKNMGKITTWRFKVLFIFLGNIKGEVGRREYCRVHGPDKHAGEYFSYEELVKAGKVPPVYKNDWIVVTGKFVGIDTEGCVRLSAISVKNEGYQ